MFCRKCGNQFPDDSVFCQKCGTEVAADTDRQASDTTAVAPMPSHVAEPSPATPATPVRTVADNRTDDAGFKEFVNNHVRSTTKFRSADDLLRNSKPLSFIWITLVVSFILGSIVAFPFGGFVFLILGYAAIFVVSGIIRMQYSSRFSDAFIGDIDIEEFVGFLSENLKQVHPDFHEWGYLSKKGLLPTLENAIADAMKEVRICSEFGTKRKHLVTVSIRPKTVDAKPGEKWYVVGAIKNGFLVDGRAAGFLGHGTLIRTAPILQAAMEYYIQSKGLQRSADVAHS